MQGMKLAPALILTAHCLLIPCKGESANAPSPHPIFEHWQEVFAAQCTPEVLFYTGEDAMPEEERAAMQENIDSEVAQVEEHATAALEAAQALYSARADLLREAMRAPGSYLNEDAKAAINLLTCSEAMLAEGFRRDLEALSFSGTWLQAGVVEPALQPGRQEQLFSPPLNRFAFEKADGCQAEISARCERLNKEWRRQQDVFMAQLRARYGTEDADNTRDPFTGDLWQDEESTATQTFRAGMQQLIDREQQAWQRYLEAMNDMVSPCPSYMGSGTGIMISIYERDLLDTRERFLCLLAAGSYGPEEVLALPVVRAAALQELHPEHRYGEQFTAVATLFRHPKLKGHPWCLRFDGCGAGFIFVQNNEVLRRFAAELPEGGRATVRGSQQLEGTPPRQVFVLHGYDPTRS